MGDRGRIDPRNALGKRAQREFAPWLCFWRKQRVTFLESLRRGTPAPRARPFWRLRSTAFAGQAGRFWRLSYGESRGPSMSNDHTRFRCELCAEAVDVSREEILGHLATHGKAGEAAIAEVHRTPTWDGVPRIQAREPNLCACCQHRRSEHAYPHWMACLVPECACAAFIPDEPRLAFEKGMRDAQRWLENKPLFPGDRK